MKKVVSLLLVGMFVFAMAAPAYAGAWSKLESGIKQIIESPKVIYNTVAEEKDASEFKPFGVIGGLAKGTVYFGKELCLGALNTLTFFFDNKE